jgi:mycothiol synthase
VPDTPTTDDAPAASRLRWQVRGAAAEAELTGGGAGDVGEAAELAQELTTLTARLGREGVAVHLAADHPAESLDPLPEAVADAAGLSGRRDLLQMRRPLPLGTDHPSRTGAAEVATRPFAPGIDDAAWIRVNNRSFAGHPDQGQEDASTLAARTAEPWFEAADFLVADEPTGSDAEGELSGFCWTKVHPADQEAGEGELGEIYVIGVDPRHRGEGLGPSFVLAGLDHLAELGITTAVLYVDADNEPARRLYDRLGFTVHRRRRVYTAAETDASGSPP